MSITLNGSFQITGWDEKPYSEGVDGAKQSHAKITQDYQGDMQGKSELQYLMAYQDATSAVFVGHETLSGKFDGGKGIMRSGSVLLQHNGVFENGVASSEFVLIKGSGTGDWLGLGGHGTFKAGKGGQAEYQIHLD